jgi:ribosomal protein L31
MKVARRAIRIHPPTFQLNTIHSDGSSFRLKTTSPKQILYLTKDTLNHSLWVPDSTMIDDQLGELKKFEKRFGSLDVFE